MERKLMCAMMALCLALPLLFVFQSDGKADTADVQARLNYMLTIYPTYSYFSANGQACTHTSDAGCSNCDVLNVPARGNLPKGSDTVNGWARTCRGFARYAFYYLNGGVKYNDSRNTVYSGISHNKVYQYAKLGDHITKPGHEGIFISGDSSGFWMYESNFGNGNTNQVRYKNVLHTSDDITIRHAYNYGEPPTEVEWATITANQTSVQVGTQVNFTVNSNVFQGQNGYYFDVYVWDSASYASGGEGTWVGVAGTSASYTFNTTGDYYVRFRVHNTTHDLYSDALHIHVFAIPSKPVVTCTAVRNGDAFDEFLFTWAPTDYTDWYDVRFYDATGNTIWSKMQYNRTGFRAHFPVGSYSMDVASVNENGKYTFSDRVSFTVKAAPTPTAGEWITSREAEHKLFAIYSKKCSWLEAEAIVSQSGEGLLAAITSQTIQDAVASAVAEFGHPVWLGGETFRHKAWTWSNGHSFNDYGYTLWEPDQPSGGLGMENFLSMVVNGNWNDHTCPCDTNTDYWNLCGYVVQYEPVSVNISPIVGTIMEGQTLTKDDINVTVMFANGTMIETTDYTLSQSGTEAGAQTLTVTYGDLTETLEITLEQIMPDADFILPEGLTVIEADAFNGLAMTSVLCPEGLEEIGARAFADCPNLRNIYIPENTLSIARTAFEGCDDLTIWDRAGSVAEAFANNRGFTFKEYID